MKLVKLNTIFGKLQESLLMRLNIETMDSAHLIDRVKDIKTLFMAKILEINKMTFLISKAIEISKLIEISKMNIFISKSPNITKTTLFLVILTKPGRIFFQTQKNRIKIVKLSIMNIMTLKQVEGFFIVIQKNLKMMKQKTIRILLKICLENTQKERKMNEIQKNERLTIIDLFFGASFLTACLLLLAVLSRIIRRITYHEDHYNPYQRRHKKEYVWDDFAEEMYKKNLKNRD